MKVPENADKPNEDIEEGEGEGKNGEGEKKEEKAKQRTKSDRLKDPIKVKVDGRCAKANLNSFKAKYLTLKKKASAMQTKVGTEPDFLILMKNNLQNPKTNNASKTAGKYMVYGEGEIKTKLFKEGIKFESESMYAMANNFDYTELKVETEKDPKEEDPKEEDPEEEDPKEEDPEEEDPKKKDPKEQNKADEEEEKEKRLTAKSKYEQYIKEGRREEEQRREEERRRSIYCEDELSF